MRRLLVHVEGQTEEEFVNDVLRPHLVEQGYASVSARLLGSRRQRAQRGGIRSWSSVRKEVERHLRGDPGLRAGLLVDYYGLPADWPGRLEAAQHGVAERSSLLATQILNALNSDLRSRFFPCVLMHEFETMVFVDPIAAAESWGKPQLGAQLLMQRQAFQCVEEINDSPLTAPSKRIKAVDPQYEKPLQGLLAVHQIGLSALRASMPSLATWLDNLEH